MLRLVVFVGLSSLVEGIPLSPNGPYDTRGAPRDGVLNVHLVPHTHDDVGWLKTVDELYIGLKNDVQIASVQLIIDSVMESLAVDSNRTFMYVEIAFFSRWWRRANDLQRNQVVGFLKSGQFKFVNGGWVSNDEATATFVDILDQHTLGAIWITSMFGSEFSPSIGFQADPFGHSLFQAKAYSEMGMDAWFFGRSDFQDFAVRKATRTLETVHTGILAASMDGYGPPPFFYWDVINKDEPLNDDQFLGEPNIEARIDAFVDYCEQQAVSYNDPDTSKTRHILLTMGTDFAYLYARSWYKNLDKLIHYTKVDGRVNVFYSSLEAYTVARHRDSRPMISHSDYDWFPYCDGEAVADSSGKIVAVPQSHAFWTGYFTSRPVLKRLVRVASAVLEVCRLAELATPWSPSNDTTFPPSPVWALWEALSVAQHHDAVSGTSKQRVADDYTRRLQSAIDGCMAMIADGKDEETIMYHSMLDITHVDTQSTHAHTETAHDSAQHALTEPAHMPSVHAYLAYYESSVGKTAERPGQASGAYIFRPDCPEGFSAACAPKPAPVEWAKLEQFEDRIEWAIGPIPDDGIGREIVLVIECLKIRNAGKFLTDSNGYTWLTRERNSRPTWELVVTDPVAGNFYPITAGIGITDANWGLFVTPDRSVGGSSIRDGQIEIMIHRRIFADDDRGVGEPLNERGPDGVGIQISGTTYFKLHSTGDGTKIPQVNLSQIRPPVAIPKSTKLPVLNVPKGVIILQIHRVDNMPEFCVQSAINDCVLVRLVSESPPDLTTLMPFRHVVKSVPLTLNAGKRVTDLHPLKWEDTSTHKQSDLYTFLLHLVPHGDNVRENVILVATV